MKSQIIGLTDWLKTPPGLYLLNWEQVNFDQVVNDIFGFHALQLGLPELNTLQLNRMPHQWLAQTGLQTNPNGNGNGSENGWPVNTIHSRSTALVLDSAALPFSENSLDLVTLPHTLELGTDPHSTLREVARVLVPEGRMVITGFNPLSLWGLRQECDDMYRRFGYHDLFFPQTGDFIGYWRLRDWLRLLNFEIESAHFGCYRPAFSSQKWLNRLAWMDGMGERWWPIFGAIYFLVAIKRVRGVRLLAPGWKSPLNPAVTPVAVARQKPLLKTEIKKLKENYE